MATLDKEEFKFPDEAPVKASGDEEKVEFEIEGEEPVKVEVADDTPPEDRNRRPMTEPPEEVTEEELNSYKDVKLRNRIAHFSKGYHEERRAKETAQREREEALAIAQNILAENERLKAGMQDNQKVLLQQAKTVAENELDQAKRKYKQAYESGDADAVIAAQEELTGVKLKLDKIQNFRPAPVQPQENVVQRVQTPQTPASEAGVDEKALDWKNRNKWFQKDREMTAFALAVHTNLVEDEGVDPRSNAYYERIDARIREKFPEKFQDTGGNEKPRRSSVVAPATRSTAPKKVVLTPSAVAIAKKLGIPLELYAKKVAQGMRNE
jgi:hypothetical protein